MKFDGSNALSGKRPVVEYCENATCIRVVKLVLVTFTTRNVKISGVP